MTTSCRLNGVGALLGRVNASYTGAVTGGVTPSVFLSIFSRRRLERAKIVGAFSSARISDFWTALLHRAAPRARCTHLAAPHELFSHPPTTGHRLPARSEMTSAVTRRVRLTVWRARLHTAAPPNPIATVVPTCLDDPYMAMRVLITRLELSYLCGNLPSNWWMASTVPLSGVC